MAKLLALLLLAAVLLFACKQDRDKSKEVVPETPNIVGTNNKPDTDTALLLRKYVRDTLFFSNPAQPDFFILEADGFEPKRTMLRFSIVNSKGIEIYSDSFKADLLLDDGIYDLTAKPTERERNKYIIDKANKFFDAKNVLKPAIKPGEEFSPEYSDKEIWQDIAGDTSAIGFYYLLAPNKGKSIAYSKKQKKVVVYFSCC